MKIGLLYKLYNKIYITNRKDESGHPGLSPLWIFTGSERCLLFFLDIFFLSNIAEIVPGANHT